MHYVLDFVAPFQRKIVDFEILDKQIGFVRGNYSSRQRHGSGGNSAPYRTLEGYSSHNSKVVGIPPTRTREN
jgi:hypothetical protein